MNKTLVLANTYTIFRVGLGTNRVQETQTSKTALKKAVALGINFIDTASAYTGGTSEKVIGETMAPYKGIVVATKGGMQLPNFRVDSRPQTLQKQLANSLEKLQLSQIPLYFLHRVDPTVPFRDQMLFLKRAQEEGKIAHIGLSEVGVAQLEEAQKYITVAAIENEYNLSQRKYDDVLAFAEQHDMVFISFFPLHFSIQDESKFQALQKKYSATAKQLAIAWLLKRSPVMVPIPGSLSPQHLTENVQAAEIELTNADFQTLSTIAA